jgi:protein SCO1
MDRKTILVGVGIFVIVGIAILVTALIRRPAEFKGTAYEPKAAEAFDLPTADGGRFRLEDQKGKTVVLFFGFTHCHDVCPLTMANLKQAVSQMGPGAQDVQVVFVTVDPDRDTSEIVQKYASGFTPSFIGLSGSMAELEQVWTKYGIFRELEPVDDHGHYEVTHTARITVIDPQGNLRLSFNYDAPWQDILHDLQLLADEG